MTVTGKENYFKPCMTSIETVTTPDKRKIKEAIEAGAEVEGAHLEPGAVTFQVR
ncbi:TPA: siphovirus Gp157 family protein [Salmonella enterica]|nr:siphovirus Gp157 family protein [Salmonella enterica]